LTGQLNFSQEPSGIHGASAPAGRRDGAPLLPQREIVTFVIHDEVQRGAPGHAHRSSAEARRVATLARIDMSPSLALPVAGPAIEGGLGGRGSRELRSSRLLVSDEPLHLCRVAEAAVKEPLLGLRRPVTEPPLERPHPPHHDRLPPAPSDG
jgi:hypothetical protein